MQSVCVFLSSITSGDPAYAGLVRELGAEIARRKLRLVYGGAAVGLMGQLADAALAEGGEVVGVIPETLVEREVAHGGLTELHVVKTMHQRKALMTELADGFLVAPGGFGTLEEAFEVLTARQLSLHDKPVILVDVRGFWAPLVTFLDRAVSEGVLRPAVRQLLVVAEGAAAALELLLRPRPEGAKIDLSLGGAGAAGGAGAGRLATGSTMVPAIPLEASLAPSLPSPSASPLTAPITASVEALDLGAQGAQPRVDALVSAVDLPDVVDGARPLGGERG